MIRRARIPTSPIVLLALLLTVAASAPALAQSGAVAAGVVSVKVTSQAHDELLPWIKAAERVQLGNAIVAADHRLITTADMVKNASLIEVRKFGRYPDFPARAVLVDFDLNVALLEVADPAFWEGLVPLPLAERPVVSGQFSINRWRANGRLEQGSGEVIDFLVSNSPYGVMEFPVMRGTTSMGGLGWSEVLTLDDRVIGLITSHNERQLQATNSDLLRLLVQAAREKPFTGFAHRGFAWQRLNQAHLRDFFGVDDDDTGVLVRHLFAGGTGATELEPRDILHRINGYAIDPEGHIEHPGYGLVLFTMAINESLAPKLEVEVERNGRRRILQLARRRFDEATYRIPPPRFDEPNDFEVFGGLVMQELSAGYLRAWGREWRQKAPARLVIEYGMRSLREPGEPPERVVIISRVLPDPSNLGYEDVTNAIVRRVNGEPVNSLADFRAAILAPLNGYHEIGLLPGSGRARLVYPHAELGAINSRVRTRYGIPPATAAR